MALERFDEALHCFDAVLPRSENDPSAFYNRACVFARRGQVQLALRALKQAAGVDSSFLDAARSDASFDGVRDSRSFRRLLDRNV
jgi:tetratricopeptide (TPR) repeat protein